VGGAQRRKSGLGGKKKIRNERDLRTSQKGRKSWGKKNKGEQRLLEKKSKWWGKKKTGQTHERDRFRGDGKENLVLIC